MWYMLVSLLIGSLCLLIVIGISWLFFRIHGMLSGIRVSDKAELAGLNVPDLGERAYPPDAEVSSQPAAATAWQPPQLDQPLPVSLRVRASQQNQAGHTSPSYQERSAIPNYQERSVIPSYQGRSAIPNYQIMSKPNCWEFKKCGRQPGGANVSEMGVCPSATLEEADSTNGGKNGGRICWAIVGTFCGGKVQGTAAEKRCSCVSCEFYRKVREEEGSSFQVIKKFGQREVSPFTPRGHYPH
jgi:hypothetical protein